VAGAAKGGRDIVAYFAGHLAHLVNGDDDPNPGSEIMIRPFQLFERVHRALVGNRRYADNLVGLWAYPPPGDADDAADFYFDQVLDRPIAARRGEPTSVDHLAALVATLAFAEGQSAGAAKAALSTWKALIGWPERRRRLVEAKDVFELSNRILKCLDAANRPYAEVLRLGLCPREWLVGDAAVGVNTLKAANAFIKALKATMNDDLGRRPTEPELNRAFAAAAVPGSATAQEFVRTPLGAAAIARIAGRDQTYVVSFDAISETLVDQLVEDEEAEPLMSGAEAASHLDGAVAGGAIAPAERELLSALMDGKSLADALSANPFLRRRVKTEFGGDVSAFVEDLAGRAARFAAAAGMGRP